MNTLDLNSDLGESFGRWVLGDDEAMLGAGDVGERRVRLPRRRPDDAAPHLRAAPPSAGWSSARRWATATSPGSARRFIDVAPNELADDVVYQIGALDGMCRVAGTAVRYVKPHGALYNAIVHHEAQAAAVVAAVRDYSTDLPVLGPAGSAFLRAAEKAGLRTVREFFVDRALHARGHARAASRGRCACCTIRTTSRARVLRLVSDGVVTAIDGSDVAVAAESACVHGDSPGRRRDGAGGARRSGEGRRRRCGRSREGAALRRRRAARRGRRASRGARAGRGGA